MHFGHKNVNHKIFSMERIVKNEIDVFIESNNLIRDSQHGFCRGRSTQTNLIEFLNVTTSWHDEGRTDDESQDVGERSDEDGFGWRWLPDDYRR